MTLVPDNHFAEVTEPSEEALDFPSTLVPSELAAILGLGLLAVTSMGSNHVDAHLLQFGVKWVRVISFVSHEPRWSAFNMGCLESVSNKGDFMWRSTFNVYGEWKRRAVCNVLCTCHDLRTLTPLGLSNVEAPFFATTKVPSMKHSVRSISPRSCKSWARACSTRSSAPERTHSWKRRWHVWYGGYLSGRSAHCAPVRSIHKMPLSTSRGLRRGLPFPSSRGAGSTSAISGASTSHCSSVTSNFVGTPEGLLPSVYHF